MAGGIIFKDFVAMFYFCDYTLSFTAMVSIFCSTCISFSSLPVNNLKDIVVLDIGNYTYNVNYLIFLIILQFHMKDFKVLLFTEDFT